MRIGSLLAGLLLTATAPAFAAGDPVLGQRQFGQCMACHNLAKGGPNSTGPNLYGVLGKPAATGKPGYVFSDALKKAGIVWTDDKLDAWLKSPATLVPGTKMAFVGIPKQVNRDNLIAYLKQEASK